jgi:predicted ATPase
VHALVREVLYEGLPAARRVRLHGRVGEALEVVYATDPGPHLAELERDQRARNGPAWPRPGPSG